LRDSADINQLDSKTTDGSGFYQFGPPPGSYIVEFVLKAGLDSFSPEDAGLDDTVDSDPDVNTGKTGIITVESGQSDTTVDAGMIQIDGEPSPQPVGGSLIPIDTTMLLLAGTQMTASWMIPVIVAGIGFAIVIARKF